MKQKQKKKDKVKVNRNGLAVRIMSGILAGLMLVSSFGVIGYYLFSSLAN